MLRQESVLIGYASRYGSTGDVARSIEQTLSNETRTVTVSPVSEIFDLHPYSAVILGTPLYGGKVLPEITTFVKNHQNLLKSIPVSLFLTGYSLADLDEKKKKRALQAAENLEQYILFRDIGLFGGCVPERDYSLMEKAVMKKSGIVPGDYRSPGQIQAWAQSLIDLRLLWF